jgi:hypothetical protein
MNFGSTPSPAAAAGAAALETIPAATTPEAADGISEGIPAHAAIVSAGSSAVHSGSRSRSLSLVIPGSAAHSPPCSGASLASSSVTPGKRIQLCCQLESFQTSDCNRADLRTCSSCLRAMLLCMATCGFGHQQVSRSRARMQMWSHS